jgi:hypothetical protein
MRGVLGLALDTVDLQVDVDCHGVSQTVSNGTQMLPCLPMSSLDVGQLQATGAAPQHSVYEALLSGRIMNRGRRDDATAEVMVLIASPERQCGEGTEPEQSGEQSHVDTIHSPFAAIFYVGREDCGEGTNSRLSPTGRAGKARSGLRSSRAGSDEWASQPGLERRQTVRAGGGMGPSGRAKRAVVPAKIWIGFRSRVLANRSNPTGLAADSTNGVAGAQIHADPAPIRPVLALLILGLVGARNALLVALPVAFHVVTRAG